MRKRLTGSVFNFSCVFLFSLVSVAQADVSPPEVLLSNGVSITTNEEIFPGDGGPKKYPAHWMMDGNAETAWVFEASGNMKPEITIKLPPGVEVDKIGLINGYSKSRPLYYANNRIEKITIRYSSGRSQDAVLSDSMEMQYVALDYNAPGLIKIVLDGISPGKKYDDTCISELDLFSHGRSLISGTYIVESGGIYPDFEFFVDSKLVAKFDGDSVARAFFIEHGKYAVFVHAAEMGEKGVSVFNVSNGVKVHVLKDLWILPYTLSWLDGHFTGKTAVPGKGEMTFREKIELP